MKQGEATLTRVRFLIVLAEAPRLVGAVFGLFLLIQYDAGAAAPLLDSSHTGGESLFAAIVVITIGSGGARTWNVLATALLVLGIVLTAPVLLQVLQLGADAHEIAEPGVARLVAGTTMGSNVLSYVALRLVARRFPRRQLTGIEVPHLAWDAVVSTAVFAAMWVAGVAPIIDTVAALTVALVVFVLAWRARVEAARERSRSGKKDDD